MKQLEYRGPADTLAVTPLSLRILEPNEAEMYNKYVRTTLFPLKRYDLKYGCFAVRHPDFVPIKSGDSVDTHDTPVLFRHQFSSGQARYYWSCIHILEAFGFNLPEVIKNYRDSSGNPDRVPVLMLLLEKYKLGVAIDIYTRFYYNANDDQRKRIKKSVTGIGGAFIFTQSPEKSLWYDIKHGLDSEVIGKAVIDTYAELLGMKHDPIGSTTTLLDELLPSHGLATVRNVGFDFDNKCTGTFRSQTVLSVSSSQEYSDEHNVLVRVHHDWTDICNLLFATSSFKSHVEVLDLINKYRVIICTAQNPEPSSAQKIMHVKALYKDAVVYDSRRTDVDDLFYSFDEYPVLDSEDLRNLLTNTFLNLPTPEY